MTEVAAEVSDQRDQQAIERINFSAAVSFTRSSFVSS